MKSLRSYEPATGELLGEVSVTPVDAINDVVERSAAAQKRWASRSIDERIRLLEEAAAVLSGRAEDIGTLLSMEMGKSFRRGIGEVKSSAGSVSYVASQVKEALKPRIMEGYDGRTVVRYDPLGVCTIISPWNYPVSMAHWMMIPALTAGNSVILKPSEETPLVAQAYVDALNTVLPQDLIQVVHGDATQGKALVRAKGIALIGFTGSMEAGKNIMKTAADGLKRIIMELGGKDPMIVLEDADVDRAAAFAVANSLENAGQMCISTERVFVDRKIAAAFEEKVVQYIQRYRIGPCTDSQAKVGPIINEHQRQRILSHIEDAVAKGARILAGNRSDGHPPRFIQPTVLADVTDDMMAAKEETFGPLVCITVFDDVEEAIASANATDYGLGAVVYGGKDAREVASRLDAGMIGINQGPGGGGDSPWIGAKMSGFGYHGSPDGHRQFTQPRVISE